MSHDMPDVAVRLPLHLRVYPTLPLEKHFRHALETHDNNDCDRAMAPATADWQPLEEREEIGSSEKSGSEHPNHISSAYRCSKHVAREKVTRRRDREAEAPPEPTKHDSFENAATASARSDVVKAVMVFEDVFPEALESPSVPLMQLDADSLVLEELAQALNRECGKRVKVIDLFSHNTCAKLLAFVAAPLMCLVGYAIHLLEIPAVP